MDRENVLARMYMYTHAVSAHVVDFETKLETSRGFIGNGEPLCTRL